jgi:hypothetical protein
MLIVFSIYVKAQSKMGIGKFKIGAGATVAIPVKNLPLISIGSDIDAPAQYGLSENFVSTADAGYTSALRLRWSTHSYVSAHCPHP